MSFTESVRTCLGKFATFDGRATRSEFWWFYLFVILVGLVGYIPIFLLTLLGAASSDGDGGVLGGILTLLSVVFWIVWIIAVIALYIPLLAAGSRRLHDRGQSGWLQLLLLVPCGNIVLIVLWALEGTPGDNAYGPKPA